ncbi:MAG: sugar transferase [Chromatiaceae bacterium]|nr:sugar transferase [Gammaproteobacteria bacterium]MCP5427587.1 sugar transferase [Chromatiaceae bacterium]MCP5447576.1 sugar transferase [Chromatiaceae bacterium]
MIKRLFDVTVSLLLSAGLVVPMLFIALAVRMKLGKPVIFSQQRPGYNGRVFKLRKFRTMLDIADEHGAPLEDALRITRFGLWLRRTSLDELPELWNVLKGEMSLVGPRPLLMEYLSLYTPEQARRHQVRPGITGWAQVNGRNAVDWDQRLRMDVWYVDNRTFLLDLKILWMTLFKVIKSEGVSQAGHVTVDRFRGSRE